MFAASCPPSPLRCSASTPVLPVCVFPRFVLFFRLASNFLPRHSVVALWHFPLTDSPFRFHSFSILYGAVSSPSLLVARRCYVLATVLSPEFASSFLFCSPARLSRPVYATLLICLLRAPALTNLSQSRRSQLRLSFLLFALNWSAPCAGEAPGHERRHGDGGGTTRKKRTERNREGESVGERTQKSG